MHVCNITSYLNARKLEFIYLIYNLYNIKSMQQHCMYLLLTYCVIANIT